MIYTKTKKKNNIIDFVSDSRLQLFIFFVALAVR